MATFLGKEGAVYIGSNAIAEVRDFSLESTSETVDATTMASAGDWMVKHATLKSWTASINCYYDSSDDNGQNAMGEGTGNALEDGTVVAVKLYPEGNTTGKDYFYGNMIVTSISRSASFDGLVEVSFSGEGTGALTRGQAA